MQGKLLSKTGEEQQQKSKLALLFNQQQSSDHYLNMKDEEVPAIELNKMNRNNKKVFLSGSEDEEENQQRLIIKQEEKNKEIDIYEEQMPQRDSQIITIQEDQFLPNEDKLGQELKSPLTQLDSYDSIQIPPSPKSTKSGKSRKSDKKSKKNKSSKKNKRAYKYQQRPFKWNTYRFLLAYPVKHWKLTLFVNLLIIATSILQAYLPMLTGELLDSTTKTEKDAQLHKELSIKFLKILVIYALLQMIRAFTNQVLQEQIYNDMREDVLRKFLSFDFNFFHKYRNGEIISRMTNDLQSAKAAVSGNIIVLFRNIITLFITISILFVLSWKLTLAILITMPLFTLITMIYSRLSKKFEKIGQEYQARLTALADEIVSGVLTVKSFCTEEKEIKKFHKQLQLNMGLAYRRGMNNGLYQLSSSLFTQFGSLIVLWYGGKLVLEDNQLSAGELASFIFYSMQLTNSSSNISESFAKIISATGAFEGVLDMLKYESLVKQSPDAVDHINPKGDLEFKNVYFSYPNTNVHVLKNFHISIQAGEYVAFVGPSGSGKSTIMHLLERFYDPQHGKIYINGTNIKQFTLKSLRKSIGYVSQEPSLFEGTIESNIIYGVEKYSQDDFEWATKAAGVWTFISDRYKFPKGFDTFVGEHGSTLSGGQKQRIAIARALIKRPNILIFDEATSALDAESEFQVQLAIDELIQKSNKSITILVVAHRLSTIVNCNRIVVLQNGGVVEQGTHQELIALEGVYRTLVERQLSGMFDIVKSDDADADADSEAQ